MVSKVSKSSVSPQALTMAWTRASGSFVAVIADLLGRR
jgi:hypothetical protein